MKFYDKLTLRLCFNLYQDLSFHYSCAVTFLNARHDSEVVPSLDYLLGPGFFFFLPPNGEEFDESKDNVQ